MDLLKSKCIKTEYVFTFTYFLPDIQSFSKVLQKETIVLMDILTLRLKKCKIYF